MTGDINGLTQATTGLMAFKNRHTAEVETKIQEQKVVIKTLAKEEVQYKAPGRLLLKLVRHYSIVVHGTISANRGWIDWSYPCQVDSKRLDAFSLSSLSSKFSRTKVV
ncbi:hypothetical protein QUF99_21945 [Bacillus sp. DX4.1]|uniref:hypothetical protein n=1 Tax=Bacillus sp. DX4.1 TaxID=3055867 RepID=UPI00259FFE2A|nr:hypothetical protein [Bacillus sp. DX4.1]MDM5189887.1 hypothetical protein [Bacillus sp. DX4.1]